ncbi:MAG TPA: hypothetical protein VFO49_20230 [Nocardioides sp.]|nr:hypothetical protein [Nocardioides sp.]
MPYSPRRIAMVVLGCVVLGAGVAMLLTADLGSDGYSTLVNGVSKATGISFLLANMLISLLFLLVAAVRRVYPGLGTVIQIVVVGWTVSFLIDVLDTPDDLPWRFALLAAAFPVLAVGIAAYLGAHTGAGPAEAAALAWDPPVPFKWSYSLVQGGGALVGWLLGATIGIGTIAVIVALGPAVDLASRLLRLDVHQGPEAEARAAS